MKKMIFILSVFVLFGSIGPSVALACHSHGGSTHCHGDHDRRGGGHYGGHRGGHNRGGGRHNDLENALFFLGGALVGAAIEQASQPQQQIAPQYYQQSPVADVCYKNVPTGYIDQYGAFIQTGSQQIQIQCR